MSATTTNMGEQGFVWFIGIVVDILDPLKAGRVKVRILNEHFNSTNIENADLPWAVLMTPTTSASKNGNGISPTGIEADSYVIGFYLDGMEKAIPVVIGTFHLPKRGGDDLANDVSYLARGEGSVKKERSQYEPQDPYKASYPFNKTMTTLSGHVVEIDDTPSHERIHVYHKSGTYLEISSDGTIVTKTPTNNIEVTVKEKIVVVENGDLSMSAFNGNIFVYAKNEYSMTAEELISMNSKTSTLTASESMSIDGSSSLKLNGDSVTITASNVTIESPVTIKGNLTVKGKVSRN